MKRGDLNGEDKVILAAIAAIVILTATAIICLTFQPSQLVTIAAIMTGSITAIAAMAVRHPPSQLPGTTVTMPADPPGAPADP